jgi:hypothetical protein
LISPKRPFPIDRFWREADIRQKEAELVGKAAILSDLKGGDGGNCLARRGPRPANFLPGYPGSRPVSTIKFAQK